MADNTQEHKDLYTIKEIAAILLVDPTTVRRWVRQGVLEALRLPHIEGSKREGYRIKRETLDKLLSNS